MQRAQSLFTSLRKKVRSTATSSPVASSDACAADYAELCEKPGSPKIGKFEAKFETQEIRNFQRPRNGV